MRSFKINKGFIVQKMSNKITIFDGEKSQLLTFNETASYIFGLIKKSFDKDSIIKSLVTKYKIDEKQASDDLEELLEKLKKLKVIS